MAATVWHAKNSSISIPCDQGKQTVAIIRLVIWKQTTSKCFETYLALYILIQIV